MPKRSDDMRHENRLRYCRKAAGMTQEQVAGAVGVSRKTYSSWETGRTDMGADRVRELSRVLGCTPNDILGVWPEDEGGRYALKEYQEEILDLYEWLAPNVRDDLVDILRSTTKHGRWRRR